MVFIKGIAVAALCAIVLSVALGLLGAVYVALVEGRTVSDFFVSFIVVATLVIIWTMPPALFFGVLYGVIRSAVRSRANSESSGGSP